MKKTFLALVLMGFSLHSLASDYLEVIVNPAAEKLDWSTPANLSRVYLSSAVKSTVYELASDRVRSTVGHVMIHFNCTDSKNKTHDFYTGMSGQENQFQSLQTLLIDQAGLSVLFNPVDDGYIESDDEVRDIIYNHYARKDHQDDATISKKENKFMRFHVTPLQCDQALAVEKAYSSISHDEPKKHLEKLSPQEKLYFGFTLDAYQTYLNHQQDPTSPLGGVCSTFAVAILKAAGVYDPAFERFWKRSVEASMDLIGGKNPQTQKNYRISLSDLISRKDSHWVTPGIETKKVTIYEPELIWNFIAGIQACKPTEDQKSTANHELCTSELMNWVSRQRSLQTHETSSITADIEEKVQISGPKASSPQYRVYNTTKTRKLKGISF